MPADGWAGENGIRDPVIADIGVKGDGVVWAVGWQGAQDVNAQSDAAAGSAMQAVPTRRKPTLE